MITASWIDMLFRKKKTFRFWYTDKSKSLITFKNSYERKEFFRIHDKDICAYQQIPTNLMLRKFWDSI